MKIVKIVIAIILIIAAFGGFITGEALPSIFMLVLGILFIPNVKEIITKNLKFWDNKAIRYGSYIGLFILASLFIDTDKYANQQQSQEQPQQVETKQEEPAKEITPPKKQVKFSADYDKSELYGDWELTQTFEEATPNKVTKIEDNSEDVKILHLTKNKYQTSYPYGAGENPTFDYTFNNSYLSVVTGKMKMEIYGYTVLLSEDKQLIYVKEKSGLVQVFKRKN